MPAMGGQPGARAEPRVNRHAGRTAEGELYRENSFPNILRSCQTPQELKNNFSVLDFKQKAVHAAPAPIMPDLHKACILKFILMKNIMNDIKLMKTIECSLII